MSGRSRRHLASMTASSMAMEAPCPEAGEVACAASPTMTIGPLCQVGTDGTSYWLVAGSSPVVASMISTAGLASSAKRSISHRFHCSVVVAASSALVSSLALGGLANHQISPEGLTMQPKNARLPQTIAYMPG